MRTSVNWINDYLDPPATADEQAELLTRAGLPFDGREDLPEVEDVRQEIELTSNRGDCLSHVGLAREIAAISGRALVAPQAPAVGSGRRDPMVASTIVTVTNREKTLCPLYTARIIRGIKIGHSPKWLSDRLRAIGQLPRNNVVDASNFVLFELGQPTHVFDLAKLAGPAIVIRRAVSGERFLPIGEGAAEVKLTGDDLVIADAERPVAIAGVKGGASSAVSAGTTDILIESATFDPVAVRTTSRRHGIASDSSFRFERGVHPAQVNPAAERLVQLLLESCGGALCEGVVADGSPIPPPRQVVMRLQRCRDILGLERGDDDLIESLRRLGFEPSVRDGAARCIVPRHRLDVEREADLIEEVLRMVGTDAIGMSDSIRIRVAPPQPAQMARQAVHDALVGMGFVETLTHSLVSESAAAAFLPPDVQPLRVSDARATSEPVLRPSILPSLARVWAHNRDHGVADVRLFESAATFGCWRGSPIEIINLAILHPPMDQPPDLRFTRGVIERLVHMILGPEAAIRVESLDALAWLSPGASITVNGSMLGTFGVLARQTLRLFGIEQPLCAAEIGLPAHYGQYPPLVQARALPAFPAIERDISAIVAENVPWIQVRDAIMALQLPHMDSLDFVTAYRGKQIGPGRKSVTMRLRFRAADRTLTHEEIDAPAARAMNALADQLAAEIRA